MYWYYQFNKIDKEKATLNVAQIADKPRTLNFSTKSKENHVIPAQAGIHRF